MSITWVDDVKAAVTMLSAEGCKIIVPPFEIRIGLCAVVSDPFGNVLNLLDMSKGPVELNLKRRRG